MSKRRVAGIAIAGVVGPAILVVASFAIWTAFRPSKSTTTTKSYPSGEVTDTTVTAPGKQLWDLLDLLIIPVALGLGVFWLSRQERKAERDLALDRQRENTLQKYFDNMAELLLEYKLAEADEDAPVRDIAQARTVAALRGLEGLRQGMLVDFLRQSGQGAILSHANLVGINLTGAALGGVNLSWADLFFPAWKGADLSGANLNDANLNGACLIGVNLTFLGTARISAIVSVQPYECAH